jgi:hypothetical protein
VDISPLLGFEIEQTLPICRAGVGDVAQKPQIRHGRRGVEVLAFPDVQILDVAGRSGVHRRQREQ